MCSALGGGVACIIVISYTVIVISYTVIVISYTVSY